MVSKEVCLITGACKGLGLATGVALMKQGTKVIITGRNENSLKPVVEGLEQEGFNPDSFLLDVSSEESIDKVVNYIKETYGRLDCLVNNAGVFLGRQYTLDSVPKKVISDTIECNAIGPFQLTQKCIPLLEKSENPRVINISSGMGSLESMQGGFPGYRMSKAAMNVATVLFHNEYYQSKGIRTLSICPGWVRTSMGGEEADRSMEEGISGMLWAVNTPPDGPSGLFFRDGKQIAF